MDNASSTVVQETPLSYDDNVAYEQQVSSSSSAASLANRIGNTKVYLLSETTTGRVGKRKHNGGDHDFLADDEDGMNEGTEDSTHRSNAILLQGPPISQLPTDRIFAYATHFDAHPLGLEWVDDVTCILVFNSRSDAQTGYRCLQKAVGDESALDVAQPIPIAFWPPEERINSSLGKSQGLKGAIRMRWARTDDVKRKGAKNESQFYRKHGTAAGKGQQEALDNPSSKRRRRDGMEDVESQRARLDEELDEFLAKLDTEPSEPSPPPSPPSKMRSDYIATDGRTLLDRTSALRLHPDDLESRLTIPLPRRARDSRQRDGRGRGVSLGDRLWSEDRRTSPPPQRREQRERQSRGGFREKGRREVPVKKTQQELDDELDAFLSAKD